MTAQTAQRRRRLQERKRARANTAGRTGAEYTDQTFVLLFCPRMRPVQCASTQLPRQPKNRVSIAQLLYPLHCC